MEKRIGQEAGIHTFRATTVTELLAEMQKYVIEHAVKGDPGTDGTDGIDGVSITSVTSVGQRQYMGQTITDIKVTYSDGKTSDFEVYANDGRGISTITTASVAVVGNETLTVFRITFTDQSTTDITVRAQNGKDGILAPWRPQLQEDTQLKNAYMRGFDFTDFTDPFLVDYVFLNMQLNIKPTGVSSPQAFLGTLTAGYADFNFIGTGEAVPFDITSQSSYGSYTLQATAGTGKLYIALKDRYGNTVDTSNWEFISGAGYGFKNA